MQSSDAAPVPPVDRALGAALTFFATSVLATVAVTTLATDPTAATDVDPLLPGATVGAVATLVLVLGDGYALLLVPVEGRRWTLELAVAAIAVLAADALVDLAPTLTVVWVALAAAVAYYGTVHVGERAVDAYDWYDRDAYAWHRSAADGDAE
ncbi:hypothetical protein [Halorubellus sp. PRR65]|uniref:hypothetical protein n=1 Tax=Halorubellus sp. PRR65 TaxID=3098148 RepID=UPI002B25FABB|nr:hypothetical protein [Halorubellus sp. PRR65]